MSDNGRSWNLGNVVLKSNFANQHMTTPDYVPMLRASAARIRACRRSLGLMAECFIFNLAARRRHARPKFERLAVRDW